MLLDLPKVQREAELESILSHLEQLAQCEKLIAEK
jgi:prephenate dehydratase